MVKVRDSGMPEEEIWGTFFNVDEILDVFQIDSEIDDVADVGAGYGTFSLPVAQRIGGVVYAVDIETVSLSRLFQKSLKQGITNIIPRRRDVFEEGTGCNDASVAMVLLFNLLHCENPGALLDEAYRILKPDGRLAIINWIVDPMTPRGPDLDIRPTPEQCIDWSSNSGFLHQDMFDFKPWHYGLSFSKG